MKTKVLLAALASMALAGCTNNEQLLDETKKGQEIRFAVAPQTPQTRAEHDKNGAYTGKLKIWAWEDGTAKEIIKGDIYDAATMIFQTGNIYYYPVNGSNVDFLAVPVEEDLVNPYLNDPVRFNNGDTNYSFSVGHDGTHSGDEHTIDLMTSEIISQNSGIVSIVLRHLTTKLNVRILQSQRQNDASICSVTLSKVELRNIKNDGSVTLDNNWTAVNNGEDCFWNSVSDNEEDRCTWTILSTAHELASLVLSEETKEFATSGSFHVLPQHLDLNVQSIYLEYTVVTKYKTADFQVVQNFSKTIDLKDITEVPHWAMNKNITYIVSINPLEEHHKITFDVEVEAWGNLNGSTTVTPSESEEI